MLTFFFIYFLPVWSTKICCSFERGCLTLAFRSPVGPWLDPLAELRVVTFEFLTINADPVANGLPIQLEFVLWFLPFRIKAAWLRWLS